MRVGVLALQGGFAAHARAVSALGHEAVLVRNVRDLLGVRALVLPGGESTVMLDLLARDPLLERALVDLVEAGAPLLATCAGVILIASAVHDPAQRSFGLLDVEVRRNARGRQVHSSEARDDDDRLSVLSIRAPCITRIGVGVDVLATLDGEPVLVRQGRVVGATFHPELTDDLSVHSLALDGRPLRQGKRVSTSVPRSASGAISGDETSVVGLASAIR